jgi:hypothetical protein
MISCVSVLEDAILMNPRLVRERVAADDGLVRLNVDPGRERDDLARVREARRLDHGRQPEGVATRVQEHHDFLE